jgi:two-component system nitrate/nitrite response regulator NarL
MASNAALSLAIIEDNRLVRETLASLLGQMPRVRVVAAPVADTAQLAEEKPDVILLDAGLRDQDSLQLVTVLRREVPKASIVVMDLLPVHEEIEEFVKVGVAGFILKDATVDQFVETIQSVAEGAKVLPEISPKTLYSHIANSSQPKVGSESPADVRLTPREREVIASIGDGLSDRDVAQRLDISVQAIRSHVRNVMEKLALHTRLQIVAYSRR